MADRQLRPDRDGVVGRACTGGHGSSRLDERGGGTAMQDPDDLSGPVDRHPDLGPMSVASHHLHPEGLHERALLTVLQHRVQRRGGGDGRARGTRIRERAPGRVREGHG